MRFSDLNSLNPHIACFEPVSTGCSAEIFHSFRLTRTSEYKITNVVLRQYTVLPLTVQYTLTRQVMQI